MSDKHRIRTMAMFTLAGFVFVTLVLATEMWVWLNLWPLHVNWTTALVWSLPLLLIWSLSVPGVVWLVLRWPIEGVRRNRHVVYHIAVSVLFSLCSLVLLDISDKLFHWTTRLGAPGTLVADFNKTIIHLHLGIALYWVLVGGVHAVLFQRQARERALKSAQLETHLVRARLDVLKTQLQPHFLFNALNSITVLVRHDAVRAERTLHQLSDFLRVVLDRADDSLVSLAQELELADHYLSIERTRFQDRLGIELRVEENTKTAAVPSLLLQPIIENAVRHGIGARKAGGIVSIAAERQNGNLVVRVQDTGPGLPEDELGGLVDGVGLTNTRRRLETMYGSNQECVTQNMPEGGFEVRIIIPFQEHDSRDSAETG